MKTKWETEYIEVIYQKTSEKSPRKENYCRCCAFKYNRRLEMKVKETREVVVMAAAPPLWRNGGGAATAAGGVEFNKLSRADRRAHVLGLIYQHQQRALPGSYMQN